MAPTRFWSYRPTNGSQIGGVGKTYLGPSFVVPRGTPTRVRWQNKLVDDSGRPIPHPLPVDPSLHWAAPFGDNMLQGPFPVDPASGQSTFAYKLKAVPMAPHVHGGEQEPQSDGGPETWFTPNWGAKGPTWTQKVYKYSNGQPRSTIWYHDHALGITRLNVYMGLAGAYLITDSAAEPAGLPGSAYDIPLVIQDRIFDTKGQLYFPAAAVNSGSRSSLATPCWSTARFGRIWTLSPGRTGSVS
jgi:spore coat protein A